MSAELDRNELTGEASVAAVGGPETMWHRSGVGIPADATYEEAVAKGGVGYTVEKVPAYYRRRDLERSPSEPMFQQAPDSYLIVRTDRQKVLGHVGNVYTPLQNRDAFRVIEPLLEDGIARIETTGALRGGADAWMLVRFDRPAILRRIQENGFARDAHVDFSQIETLLDEVVPYGLIANNHDGSRKVVLKETAVRVVCANTLAMSLNATEGTTIKVKHTGDVEDNVRASSRILFGSYAEKVAAFAGHRTVLRRTDLPEPAFDRLILDPVVPFRHLEKRIQKGDASGRTEAALERALNRRQAIRNLWDHGKGHEGARNAWEAYNALIEWTDHAPDAISGDEERRIRSAYNGKLDRVKHERLNALVTYATSTPDEREALLAG